MKRFALFLCILLIVPLANAAQLGEKCGICVDSSEKLCAKELICVQFPNKDNAECAKSDPCSNYKCPAGTQCQIVAGARALSPSLPGSNCNSDTVMFMRCESSDSQGSAESHSVVIYPSGVTGPQTVAVGANRENKLKITAAKENEGTIEGANVVAKYKGVLQISEDGLYIKTSSKILPVKVSPDEAVEIAGAANSATASLEEDEGKAVYKISDKKQGKFLFIFPVKASVQITVNAETGEIIETEKPWWVGFS